MSADTQLFIRDRMTVLSYSVLGAYTFWLYAFGPALSLLRAEFGFSYTMISVYSALWAAGSIVAGLVFPALAARVERRALLWSSVLVTTCGAALFTLYHGTTPTLIAALVMGWAGTTVQTTTQSVLADRHGPRRDTAFVESNIGAGAAAVLAPLALGILQSTPATWRTGMAVPAVGMVVLYLLYRRESFPAVAPPAVVRAGRNRQSALPWRCRLLCVLVAVGIGVEFCVVYFGAELLSATTHLATSVAATAMTAFYAGILVGRIAGARLTRRPGRTTVLVVWSLAITLAGLLTLLLSTTAALAVIGLFATGLGIANQFPLVLALALTAAPHRTDAANAHAQLLGGVVVLASPFLLGIIADHTGLIAGFAIAPVLTAASALCLIATRRTPVTETSAVT
ncbi:MFS transporter [Nocardia sp. NEAU-G5]|uniref:MFS transporter n=1 Tax=Nocardia albiluteola TaxID=2842303 RepID=A0ABS6B7V4_9NOCA|nr:MFS transporter [Nocardia albiluteola]MBU3066395.1 MFS transporter [Nocardia albiluteola]